MDKSITKDKFIEYLSYFTDDKNKIAYSCSVTDFGRQVVGNNLFNKAWNDDGDYVEVHAQVAGHPIKKKIKKYKSWKASIEDFKDPVEVTGILKGIIKLYL